MMLTSKLEAVQKSIQKRRDPHFAWIINESSPWAPVTGPLSKKTLALLSTCGVYRLDTQLPFDAWHDLGDPSFRAIHIDTPPSRLRIAHSHYDHTQLAADLNVAVPIEHLTALVEEQFIGRLYPWAYSFMGYLPEPGQLIAEASPIVARRLKSEGVEIALLTPC
jgi:D-proline reductase (dithiol) PrdB